MDGRRRRPTSYEKVRRFAWFFRAPPGEFPGPDADLPSFAALRGASVCHAPSGRFITGAQASASPATEEKLSEVRNASHSRAVAARFPRPHRASRSGRGRTRFQSENQSLNSATKSLSRARSGAPHAILRRLSAPRPAPDQPSQRLLQRARSVRRAAPPPSRPPETPPPCTRTAPCSATVPPAPLLAASL
jgi:hypothetical protein